MDNSDNEEDKECPLCMEPFELDDLTFYPCTCEYQICRFCWHRIRTDENGLCPACRKPYPEDPVNFKPLTAEELQRIKNEKKQKEQQKKQKISDSRKHLSKLRVVQKNLVFVVGLSSRLADQDVLKRNEYFGRFGKIQKIMVNSQSTYVGSQGPSASAYVTYYRADDALRAIQTINNLQVDGRTIKASLGTTKYCSNFLKNAPCSKPDCMYLHEVGDDSASFTKEEMQLGKHTEYERKLLDQVLGQIARAQTNRSPVANPPEEAWQSAEPAPAADMNQTRRRQTNRTRRVRRQAADSQSKSCSPPADKQQRSQGTNSSSKLQTPARKQSQPAPSQCSPSGSSSSESPLSQADPNNQPIATEADINTQSQPLVQVTLPATSNPKVMHPLLAAVVNTQSLFSHNDGFLQQSTLTSSGASSAKAQSKLVRVQVPEKVFTGNGVDTEAAALEPSTSQFVDGGPLGHMKPETLPVRQSALGSVPVIAQQNDEPVLGSALAVDTKTDWMAAFGFKSEPLSHKSDDDLGFDPFAESCKGLADLLDQERQQHAVQQPREPAQLQPSFRHGSHPYPATGIGASSFDGGMSQFSRPPMSDHFARQPYQLQPQHHHQQMHNGSVPLHMGQESAVTRALFASSQHRLPLVPRMNGVVSMPPGRDLQSPAAPPGSFAPPRGGTVQDNNPYNMKEWQDTLRQLLPNVNISFAQNPHSHQSDAMPPRGPSLNLPPPPGLLPHGSAPLNFPLRPGVPPQNIQQLSPQHNKHLFGYQGSAPMRHSSPPKFDAVSGRWFPFSASPPPPIMSSIASYNGPVGGKGMPWPNSLRGADGMPNFSPHGLPPMFRQPVFEDHVHPSPDAVGLSGLAQPPSNFC